MVRKISVTEALNELKLYDDKIYKAINGSKFVGAAKKSSEKMPSGVSKKDFGTRAIAELQSVTDLIENRNKIKSAIVNSNANTEIIVADKKMSRAEGIERKTSIAYEETLLENLKQQYADMTKTVDNENRKVDSKVDTILSTVDDKDTDLVEKSYRANNEFELVDPCGLYEKIQKLEDEIFAFKSNIDTALTMSNATTFIELNF